jgi:hypothetical protein
LIFEANYLFQSTNFTPSLSFDDLQNLSQSGLQQTLALLQSTTDLRGCLVNCSNQGICNLINQTYACECNANTKGISCQTDILPCSRLNKCLNNGTCINSIDLTSFTCQCPENSPFYGQYCENAKNICENVTCSFHGYCTANQNETKCKCYNGFEGENCELELNLVKIVRFVQWTTTVICIICLIKFWFVIIGSDVLDYLKVGDEIIDVKKWKRQKIFGKEQIKGKKNIKKARMTTRNTKKRCQVKHKRDLQHVRNNELSV